MNLPQAINNSVEPADKLNPTKTMYDVSGAEIFFKNFLAGAGRAFGGIILYLIFFGILLNVFVRYALPSIQPFIDEYRQALQGINKLKTTGPDLDQYQQFLDDLKSSIPNK